MISAMAGPKKRTIGAMLFRKGIVLKCQARPVTSGTITSVIAAHTNTPYNTPLVHLFLARNGRWGKIKK